MKIQKVTIKDFKAIKDFEKDINGNSFMLIGENGVGKSTVIQFLKIALGDQSVIPPNASGEGEVITDKDGKQYTFSVKFDKAGKPVVTVTAPDGMKDARKGTIASIVGAMSFDIDQFVELSKSEKGRREQVEIFKSFLDEGTKEELKRYEANIKANYDERTEINRAIKEKEGAVKSHKLFNRITVDKFAKVDIDSVYAELSTINEKNAKILKAQQEANNIQDKIKSETEQIEALKSSIAALTTSIEANTERAKTAAKWLSENILVDAAELEAKIKDANEKNAEFEASEQLKKDLALIEKSKEEAGELTAKIESEKAAIENAIKDMSSPVEGLMFDDSQLLYNGIPVSPDTLSTSEIMELGVKLKMAENPELGILFLERGESLGAKRLKEIQTLAETNGWQLIMEQVQRGQEKLTIEIMGA